MCSKDQRSGHYFGNIASINTFPDIFKSNSKRCPAVATLINIDDKLSYGQENSPWGANRLNGPSRSVKYFEKFYYMRSTISPYAKFIAGIVCIVLLCTLIIKQVSILADSGSEPSTGKTTATPQLPLQAPLRTLPNAKDILAPKDLTSLANREKLNVQYLVQDSPSTLKLSIPPEESTRINSISFGGPTSEAWLGFLLQTFVHVKELSLNINELCMGAKKRERSTLEALRALQVETLTIERASLCPLMTWVFKWEMPNIKQIFINDARLTQQDCDSLMDFLELNKKSLESITVTKSLFCSDCDFSNSIMREMDVIVLEQLVEPDYPDDDAYYDEGNLAYG